MEKNYLLIYQLKQQTPLIHFQYNEQGATLRASEVKPKLDRFLIEQLRKEEDKEDKKKFREKHKTWFIDSNQHFALDYKMSFRGHGTAEYSETVAMELKKRNGNGIAKSYFGNQVSGKENGKITEEYKKRVKEQYKETVFYNPKEKENYVEIKIICFNKDLRKIISEYIIPFFLLHNFGTRQDKGFGSFKIVGKGENGKENPEKFRDYDSNIEIQRYFSKTYYTFKDAKLDINDVLNDINNLYMKMRYVHDMNEEKNAVSFILDKYFKDVKNERDWLNDGGKNGEKYKFIRTMLGLSGFGDKRKFFIPSEKNKYIQRFASPILFKVIDDNVYILPKSYDTNIFSTDGILNKPITLENVGNKANTKILHTPKSFDLDDFLEEFYKSNYHEDCKDYQKRGNKSND